MPYWLDGVIPLAWLLRNQALMRRIEGYLDYIIGHQHDDGWLGPRVEDRAEAADLWSQALALKVLVGYHDATADERVPGCVKRALRMLDRHVDRNPLSHWGQYRWFEVRIPGWAQAATIEVDGRRSEVCAAGEFHTVERTWSGATSPDAADVGARDAAAGRHGCAGARTAAVRAAHRRALAADQRGPAAP